jgi:uncharacterized protein with HEPN domain
MKFNGHLGVRSARHNQHRWPFRLELNGAVVHRRSSNMDMTTAIERITQAAGDMITAIERILHVVGDMTFEAFENDWQRQWLVERGILIVSEASRRLSGEVKSRHPDIHWRNVAGIGNVLRHRYGWIEAAVMWAVVQDNLPQLERVCRDELDAARRAHPGHNEG